LGINFSQIPVNQPVCPFAHTQRDGQGNMLSRKNRKPYHPNRDDAIPVTAPSAGGWDNYKTKVSGIQDRLHGPKFNVCPLL
jgi:catalase